MRIIDFLKKKWIRRGCEQNTPASTSNTQEVVQELTSGVNDIVHSLHKLGETTKTGNEALVSTIISSKPDDNSERRHRKVELTVTILATVAAIFSCWAAYKTNEITQRSNELTLKQIQLDQKEMINAALGYSDDMTKIQTVYFSNEGGAIENFSIDVIPCFRIYASGGFEAPDLGSLSYAELDSAELADILIPIKNDPLPLLNVINTHSEKGAMASISLTPHLEHCLELMEEFSTLKQVGTISLEYYIRIKYSSYITEDIRSFYHCRTGYYYDHERSLIKNYPIMHFSYIPNHLLNEEIKDVFYFADGNAEYDENGNEIVPDAEDYIFSVIWSESNSYLDLLCEKYINKSIIQYGSYTDPDSGMLVYD